MRTLISALLFHAAAGQGCFRLEGSLSCPDWSRFELKPNFANLNRPHPSTRVADSVGVTEFDLHIHSLLDPTNVQYPSKLIDAKACGTVRSAVAQMSQPLLCASSISDPINNACDSHPPPVCHHACLRQVDAILALMDVNPSCFVNSTAANFYDSRAALVTTCGRPHMKGEKGKCLLLDSQEDKSTELLSTFQWMMVVTAGLGIVALLLILGVTVFLVRRRRKVPVLEKSKRLLSPDSQVRRLITDFPFFARRDDEIHLNRSDEVVLFQEFDDGWALGRNCRTGASGKFPLMCLNVGCVMQPISLKKSDNTYRVIPKRSSSTLSLHLTSSIRSQLAPSFAGSDPCPNSLGVDITPTASYKFKPIPRIKNHLSISNNSSFTDLSHFPLTPPPPSHSPPRPPLI